MTDVILSAESLTGANTYDLRAESDPMVAADWISAGERERLGRIGSPISRNCFLAGRRLLKGLVATRYGLARHQWHRMHIESRNGRDQGVAPLLYVDGKLQSVRLSLSHCVGKGRSPGHVVAAVTWSPNLSLGVDVAPLDALPLAISTYWFSADEFAACLDDPRLGSLVWSAKEAIYKTEFCGRDQAFSPRQIDVLRWITPAELTRSLRVLGGGGSPQASCEGPNAIRWFPVGRGVITLALRTCGTPTRIAEPASVHWRPPAADEHRETPLGLAT